MQHNASAPRFEWLDGVRGMAIIWITFFHCILAYGKGCSCEALLACETGWPARLGKLV